MNQQGQNKNPTYKGTNFMCPNCGVHAKHLWLSAKAFGGINEKTIHNLEFSFCDHCTKYSLWKDKQLLFPSILLAPLPNGDMPGPVKEMYEEARGLIAVSPKASAALLRLTLLTLLQDLNLEAKDLSSDIDKLIERGLPTKIKKVLASVRFFGEKAVPPGQMDSHDNSDVAFALFSITNLITEVLISQPKHIDDLFQAMPSLTRKASGDPETE